ncbi:MAG: hypothetical protein V7K89_30085 [Nostoc sp.]|uniref:hypothetical protein n=1 Tax=Nostoc sp. TaxID=1180 RepID=UPI002FFABD89
MFAFHLIDETNARAILSWRYEPPYDLYNYLKEEANLLQDILNPQNNFYSIMDENRELVAYCSFEQDGQVTGGNYRDWAKEKVSTDTTNENSTWRNYTTPRACESCVMS